jgi:hypothetical protein
MKESTITLENTGTNPHFRTTVEVCGKKFDVGDLGPKDKKKLSFVANEESRIKIETYKENGDGIICSLGSIKGNESQKIKIELNDFLIRIKENDFPKEQEEMDIS